LRISGKRHLLITGGRGSGKSTLLRLLFPEALPGITTSATPREAVYLRENTSGQCIKIGIYCEILPGQENKMLPICDGFSALGVQALSRCLSSNSEWITIDEIGYLESCCEEYTEAIRKVMQEKRVAAVVRKQALPFLDELLARQDVFIVDLDAPFGSCGCVIMASGEGKRFGSNKLMADFCGMPLIGHALAATQGIFSSRIVVTRHEDVAALCRDLGADVLVHDLPSRSDTVRLGLEALSGVDRCLFCPGDQPLLRRETVAALALCALNDPASIWRPAFHGQEGAPVMFPQWAFPQLSSLPNGKGGSMVVRANRCSVRTLPLFDAAELADADTPDDLIRLAAHYPQRTPIRTNALP